MSSAHCVLPVRFLDRWPRGGGVGFRLPTREERGRVTEKFKTLEMAIQGTPGNRLVTEGTNTTIDLVQRSHAHALQVFTLNSFVFFFIRS